MARDLESPPEVASTEGRDLEPFPGDAAPAARSQSPEELAKGHFQEEARDFGAWLTSKMRAGLNGATFRHAADIAGFLDPEHATDYQREYHQASKDNPGTELLGGLAAPLPGVGKLKALTGLGGLAARAGANALIGAGAGLATGDTETPATQRALYGAGAGLVGGAAAEGAGALLGKTLRGVVKPSEAAQLLRSKGVDLSVGQMNPGGFASKLEEAGQHSILGGRAIHEAQQTARGGWQDAVLREARPDLPPDVNPDAYARLSSPLGHVSEADAIAAGPRPLSGTVPEKLQQVYEEFTPAYQAAKAAPLLAGAPGNGPGGLVALSKAFDAAVSNPNIIATDAEMAAAKRFLDNQLSIVNNAMEKRAAGGAPLTGEALLAMRSNIRGAIRDALKRQDYTTAKLLGGAEDALTGSLQQQLPSDALSALNEADRKYGVLKAVQDAVRRGGDQEAGFTPAQLSAAVRANTQAGAYARGAGGPLRELAQAGREVLDAKAPPTGVQALKVPAGLHHLAAPLMALANATPVKQALLGEHPAQEAILRYVAQKRLPALSPSAATAEALSPLSAQPVFANDKDLKRRAQLAALTGDTP